MTRGTGSISVVMAALMAAIPTFAAAECASSIGASRATAADRVAQLSAQQKAKKSGKDQSVSGQSSQKNCPPEHKAQGHC